MRLDSNIAHFFFLVNRGMFIPYASVYTVSTSAASGLAWKCSLEGQHIFSITAARIVAELRRFVAESFIGADGYRCRKWRNKDGSQFVHDCPRRPSLVASWAVVAVRTRLNMPIRDSHWTKLQPHVIRTVISIPRLNRSCPMGCLGLDLGEEADSLSGYSAFLPQ